MNLHIKADSLTKIFPPDPLDHLAYLTFGRAVRGQVPAQQPLREKIAVDGVSFELHPGDRIGIIGRNGAGKSTLLAMIAGMLQPTSGSVSVEGHVTAVMTLGIGLREDLSGRENIYVDGELQGKTRSEVDQVIEEAISFAELGEFIDYPIRTYSTGMKARLAFAMIIHLEPEILIIDEALSVGDAFFSVKATRKIQEICDRGKIVIIVSHGMNSIKDMCNRCLWMDNGRIVMDGEPSRVTTAYVDAVREADEKELQHKFRSMLGAFSLREGGSIADLRVTDGEGSENRAIFPIGSGCRLRFGIIVTARLRKPRLVVRFTRMDGLLVGESALDNAHDGLDLSQPGRYRFDVELAPLIFGRGVFEVTLELADRAGPVARSSIIMEMQSLAPEIGGRPVLVAPCRLQSAPVS